MNNRKNIGLTGIVLAAAGIILGASLFNGCVSTQVVSNGTTNTVPVLDPAAAGAIKGVLSVAVPYAVSNDPNAAPYLTLAANVFSMAAESGTYDPAAIQTGLDAISIRELRTSQVAKDAVKMAFAAYKGLFGDAVNAKLDQAKWGPFAKSLLQAMADGIKAGLPE